MTMKGMSICAIVLTALATFAQSSCPSGEPCRTTVSGGFDYEYPYPIRYLELNTQHQKLCQAYMDVPPIAQSNLSRAIMLLHGKNFCGVTWTDTIETLRRQNYRVIVPDQIGFCKSDKPTAYQFSLQQLALNTKTILDDLEIDELVVMGHSMGGMLAARFTLMYPSAVPKLVLVDPIGLEDWKTKGVPYLSIDEIYLQERASNYSSIRGYEQSTYYAGTWKPAYDQWVNMLLKLYDGPLGSEYAFDQALVTDMVYTQPIVYEFPLLADKKVLLVVGDKDNTAIGKQWSPHDVQRKLGHYKQLGKESAAAIGSNCTLVEYPELGHAPFVQKPEEFFRTLLSWLD